MKRIIQIIFLIAVVVGVILSVVAISKPVPFSQTEGVVEKVTQSTESINFWLKGDEQEYVIYFDTLLQEIDVGLQVNDGVAVKWRDTAIQTEKIVVCQLTVKGELVFSNYEQQLQENSLVFGGLAFCLCMVLVFLILTMAKRYPTYTPQNFRVGNPNFVEEMGYFFATLCIAPSVYVALLVLLKKTAPSNLYFLIFTCAVFLLSLFIIYICKSQFFSFDGKVYRYGRPFRRAVEIPLEKICAVQLEENKGKVYCLFLRKKDEVIFRMVADVFLFVDNYFIDSLIANDLALRIREEDGQINTVDYDQLINGE